MKVKQKVIAGLVCVALSVTDIFSVGFSVSASELNQQLSLAVENYEETEYSLQETSVSESKTNRVYPLEDVIAEESEDVAKTEETENETRKEESVEESTEDETEIQQENSELEESVESEMESETQEQKTELENKSDSQKKIEKGELKGAYQFGDSPADSNGISTYSVNLSTDTNISKLEEYLYQQMKAKNETIDVESYDISRTEIGNIVSGVINEHPDLYFINKDFSYSVSGNSTIVAEVIMSYNDSWDDSAFQRTTKKALAVVKAEMSDLEKAVALHDYLAVNCEYDKERLEAGTIPDESFSAYGVLVNRIAVCQGYALAYKYLLNQVGINCYMVTSKEMNHAWNLIELNGIYYQVDVTWDDPTWDLIGRARHKYMFRSDDDFVNECKHHDWSVTKGNEVVDYKAVDTTYDTAFWLECDSPLVLVDKDCYYTAFNEQKETGTINRASLSDSTQKGTEICEIGEWTVWGNDNGYYFEVYSGLFQANNRLYFNDKTSIYSIDLDDIENEIDKRTEFTADTTDGYIYGSAFCQGKVLYSLRQEPIISSRDTVLTADIEIEQPSEIPVEKIELDKKTLILTVGSTAKLQATVTPDDAIDLEVTWISSDDAVAKVENGTVTAIASGNCTITVSVGGKTVSCDVTVSELGEDIVSGSYKNITWVIDANGKLTVTGTGDFMENEKSPWYDYRHFVISAEINVTGASDVSYMFKNHQYLTYVDMDGFNTSQVTNMKYMFRYCEELEHLNLGSFDTSNVIDMRGMFSYCYSLESLDLSSFDTSKVTDMGYMFFDCYNLESLNLSSFDIGNVIDMGYMFSECESLRSLDLSNFDTGNVADMRRMFYCCGLRSLDLSSFDTGNVTDMGGMFSACSSLGSLDLSNFDTRNVTDMGGMFSACSSLGSLDLNNFDTGNVTDMSYMFSGCESLRSLDLSHFDTGNVTDMGDMFSDCNSLESINLSNFNMGKVTTMNRMFSDCTNLTSIDLSRFNVGKVEHMDDIFRGCSKLITIYTPYNVTQTVSLPIVGAEVWYTPDGTAIMGLPQNLSDSIMLTKKTTVPDDNIISGSDGGITWMIDANGKLTVIGTGEILSYNTKKAPWDNYKDIIISAQITVTTDMHDYDYEYNYDASDMFLDYGKLESLDLSGFDTKNVTNMSSMFSGCSSLTSINLSGFDTKNVTNMSSMFFGCSSLTSIDLRGFDTGNVTDMRGMFSSCSSLTSIDLRGFDTENVTDMSSIFSDCSSLTDIDVSSFNTRNTAYMSNMFENCSKLTYLDLSNFNLTNFEGEDGETEKDVYGMLDGCINLTTIYTPYNLFQSVTLPVTETDDIWYQSDGTQITELPKNLDYSITILKNSVPSISEPYITAKKEQTFYECGDILNLSDLKVMYHNVDGTVREVNDFSTNKDEIDMSTAGIKILKISYHNLEATIRLNVKQCIASGSYEGITWIINSKGKLIVKGTGDFAEPSKGDFHSNYDIDRDRAPWYAYKDSIISAEVNVTDITDASYMFNECKNLKSIELGGLDTGSITNMMGMFCRCESLEDINVSKFNTGNVTNMGAMFCRCLELTSIDMSNFDTSKVTSMGSMFAECWSLETIDVSGFDTSKVTSMSYMFWSCLRLGTIDVSGFDTSKVTSMSYMFTDCRKLTSLDMSGFDASKVTDSSDMFLGVSSWNECGVTTIYTPCNLRTFIELTSGDWYQPDGTVITELPKNLPYSILITKDTIPTVSTSHIVASKAKKVYTCGDTLNIDDLTVRFYDTDGTVKTVTDYTTNADTIDMSTAGTKKLIVTYKGMTTEIKLTVTGKKAEAVTISGISVENSTYTKTEIIYKGTASVKLQDGTDVTNKVVLTYTYSGTQADGSAYAATQNAPVNAGNYKLTVSVDSNNADYTGSTEYSFTIAKSPLTITARDMGLKIGAPLPQRTDYQYDTAGLFEGDSLTIQPTLTCSIADTTKAGTYDITVSGADAGMNYEITYKNGTLTVSGTGESTNYYTVTFSLSGHGSDIIDTGVKEGSILEKPQDPQAEGYTFTGWYKDQSCTVLWDFDKDTVQSDTTLYASWTKKDTIVGDDEDDSSYKDSERIDLASASVNGTIANIKAKVYDQNAYEPVVKVTVMEGKKKITLTEGTDYRVIYQDNVNAGEGKVIVKGNGIYKGQIEKNFTISPKPVKKLKVLTSGIVGTATMQVASDAVYVYDGTKRLVENVDYELSDVQPVKNKTDVVQVTVKGKKTGNYDGVVTAKITVYESGTDLSKLITPDSVTLIPESSAKSATKAAGEAYAYTGKAVKPEVTVKIGDALLDKKAYKVQYQNNKNAGTAYVVVTGKGEYRGKAVVPFTIKAETQESTGGLKIMPIKEVTYNGKLQKPSVKVTIQKDGKPKNLSKKDYTVTYKDNLHAGIAAVTVIGKGNYAGLSATAEFRINRQQIRKTSLKGTQGNLILTYNKRTLREGTDYEILTYETMNKNKVKVTIKGKKDFINEMEKTIKMQ